MFQTVSDSLRMMNAAAYRVEGRRLTLTAEDGTSLTFRRAARQGEDSIR